MITADGKVHHCTNAAVCCPLVVKEEYNSLAKKNKKINFHFWMNRRLYSAVYFHHGGRCMTLIIRRIYAKCTFFTISKNKI